MSAEYYDSRFRKGLLELLLSCRKMLQQVELSSTDKEYNFFITDTIKKVDEAYKIVSPSPFDFLTERKLEKLQSDEFLRKKAEEYDEKIKHIRKDVADELREKLKKEIMQQYQEKLTEEIKEEVIKEYREKLTKEIRAELTPIIKEECKQERKLKKARKRAKTLELIQNEILSISQETQTKISKDNNIEDAKQQQVFESDESDSDDGFDNLPEPENLE